MSQILPLERLAPPKEADFPLAVPNPILKQSRFLILPGSPDWGYRAIENSLTAQRHLILADRMWVREGEAEFDVLREGYPNFRVRLKVSGTPYSRYLWKSVPEGRSLAGSFAGHAELRPRLGPNPESGLRIYCELTERHLEFSWEADSSTEAMEIWKKILLKAQCH